MREYMKAEHDSRSWLGQGVILRLADMYPNKIPSDCKRMLLS